MPIYDYECRSCGPFTAMQPMALSAADCPCPDCGAPAPRAFLSAPAVLGMDPARRTAMAVNERSRHSPFRATAGETSPGRHGPGCGCCKPKKRSGKSEAAKSFPKARPWMISH